jgi:hypothetical protein
LSYFQGSSGISSQDTIGLHFGTATAAGSPFQFVQNGNLNASGTVTAVAFNATSTKRVKKAIKKIGQEYLDKFTKLKPREYDRKDYEAHEFGFIAEEMALVYPEIVGRDGNGKPSGIDYGRLSAILTAKVQEQQVLIDKLTSQVATIMGMLKGSK